MTKSRDAVGVLLLAFALIAAACGDDDAATTSTAATTTQAPPTTDSLPGTEWRITVTTEETEVEGGVHLDSTIRLEDGLLSAAGTLSQDVEAVNMVQGAVVECSGKTYDEPFLWSATPHGSGELVFGESGSVIFEFDAVIVTPTHMRGLGSGAAASSRVCGEWNGTYAGTSGALADAVGTFTVIFPQASDSQTWTFAS